MTNKENPTSGADEFSTEEDTFDGGNTGLYKGPKHLLGEIIPDDDETLNDKHMELFLSKSAEMILADDIKNAYEKAKNTGVSPERITEVITQALAGLNK